MRFNMLGTLEVIADSGEKVPIPRPRVRELLAVLLLMNGRPVSAESLIEAVWGEDAPSSRVGTLRTHVYLLRRNLAVAERLHREDGGYLLDVRSGELDLADFRALAAQGQWALEAGDLPGAEDLLRRAVGLWRLSEVRDLPATPAVTGEVVKLSGERVRAHEQLIEAMLRQGRYRELVPELEASVSVNPLNERAWEQLIVALYGLGRRAEAIQAYNGVRTLLGDEYGIDPGPRLRGLFQQLLRDDPALSAEPPLARELPGVAGTARNMIRLPAD
jgi:DNA-binding SARP family transcriptional activator